MSKLRTEIDGKDFHFTPADLASAYLREASEERRTSLAQKNLREQRYHEGRATAFEEVGRLFAKMTIVR